MPDHDLADAHARLTRLEDKVDQNQTKIGEMAEKVSWIKGYLQDKKDPPVPAFTRDAGMVAGGGGLVGAVLYALEQIFSTGAVP